MNRATLRLLPVFAATVLAAGGCTATNESGTPDSLPVDATADNPDAVGETNDADTAVDNEPGAESFNQVLVPSSDLINPAPLEILDMAPITLPGGGAGLVLAFELGSHLCYGIDLELNQGPEDVTVQLHGGNHPDVDPLACDYGVYPYTTTVALDEPLGDRAAMPAEPDESVATVDALPNVAPGEGADFVIGHFIEDAVEWAITNDLQWRVVSFDGEVVGDSPSPDTDRIAFVVKVDRVVAYEWS